MRIAPRMLVPEITVVLPSYNSGHVIADSVARLSHALAQSHLDYEILVVDDGSTDDTGVRLVPLDPRVRALTSERNRGKGAAIKQGLQEARAPYIVYTDDDVPYGAAAVLDCYHALLMGAAFVIGDRTLPASRIEVPVPVLRRVLSSGFVALMHLLRVQDHVDDTQCGLKGLSAQFAGYVLRCSRIDRFSFDLELIAIADANGIAIARLPVVLRIPPIVSGRIFAESARMFVDLFRIARNRRRGVYRMLGASQPA